MHARETKLLTGTRLVALFLTAMLIAGLVALRVGRNPDVRAVPADAVAGDLVLEPCVFRS